MEPVFYCPKCGNPRQNGACLRGCDQFVRAKLQIAQVRPWQITIGKLLFWCSVLLSIAGLSALFDPEFKRGQMGEWYSACLLYSLVTMACSQVIANFTVRQIADFLYGSFVFSVGFWMLVMPAVERNSNSSLRVEHGVIITIFGFLVLIYSLVWQGCHEDWRKEQEWRWPEWNWLDSIREKVKPINGETSMLKELNENISSFIREYRDPIFWTALLFIADYFFLNGAFRTRLTAIMEKGVKMAEGLVDRAQEKVGA